MTPADRDVLCAFRNTLCDIIDVSLVDPTDPGQAHQPPDLSVWSGLAGIGCALVQLSPGLPQSARAEQTCRQILDRLAAEIAERPLHVHGVLSGKMSILVASIGLAEYTQSPDKIEWVKNETAQLLEEISHAKSKKSDFANGVAGTLCLLVWLAQKVKLPAEKPILLLAGELCARTEKTLPGLALASAHIPSYGPLCGLAHGGSGAAVAMLEASHYLGCKVLSRVAVDLLQRELAQRVGKSSWPDFRRFNSIAGDDLPAHSPTLRSAGYTWCYGSAGIALSVQHFGVRMNCARFTRLHREMTNHVLSSLKNHRVLPTNLCVCHGLGSLMGLLSSINGDPGKESQSQLLTPYIDHCRKALSSVVRNERGALEKHFNVSTQVSRAHGRLAQWSYYLGASGLAAVYKQAVHEGRQHPLLLPFHV